MQPMTIFFHLFPFVDDPKEIARPFTGSVLDKMSMHMCKLLLTVHDIYNSPVKSMGSLQPFNSEAGRKSAEIEWILSNAHNYRWTVKLWEHLNNRHIEEYGRYHHAYLSYFAKLKNPPPMMAYKGRSPTPYRKAA